MQIDSAKLASGLRLIAEAFEETEVEAKQPAVELLSRYEKPAEKEEEKSTNVTPIGTADMYGAPPPAVPEQVAPTVDKAEIFSLLQELRQREGDTSGPDLLLRYGASQFSKLPVDRYGEFAGELKQMLGGQ